jgi:hypothetical protein
MKRLQSSQRTKRQELVDSRRGLKDGPSASLGVILHITDDYIPELDLDPDCQPLELCTTPAFSGSIRYLYVCGQSAIDSISNVFDQAENLVRLTFAAYDILMDLTHTREGFHCDIIVDDASSAVIGSQEFVFMKKYLWIESLVVSNRFRRKGYGKEMIKRLMKLASISGKSILLYSLFDSLPFYFSCGFQLSKSFPFCEGHHGLFMELELKTA